ncbi:lytic transglycosylase domain-containing protein [Rhizorhapis sp. SPR117]|uniref:lytic transglycosylase domain-containing protein n=1 Tax=Rhizorhapis sp. SPR117 TaxID=2912611 RepID=UPI0030C8391D
MTGTLSFLFPAMSMLAAVPAVAATVHPYGAYVTEAAARFGIPEAWIWAVMRAESNGDRTAISRAGAMGLMQIMPGTWGNLTATYGLGDNPWDVRANIHAGAAYLRAMFDRYGDLTAALAAYNAGPSRVDNWRRRGLPLPPETIAYVTKVAPMLGTASIASPAIVPAPPRPVAPSWQDATLFVQRDEGTLDRDQPAVDPAPTAQPGGIPSAPVPSPSSEPPRPSSSGSHGLFVPISGRSER